MILKELKECERQSLAGFLLFTAQSQEQDCTARHCSRHRGQPMPGSCEQQSCQQQRHLKAQTTCNFLKADESTLQKPAKQHQKSPWIKFSVEHEVLFVAIIWAHTKNVLILLYIQKEGKSELPCCPSRWPPLGWRVTSSCHEELDLIKKLLYVLNA